MPSTARFLTGLTAFAAAATGFQYSYARLKENWADVLAMPGYVREIADSDRQYQEMDAATSTVHERLRVKKGLVYDLIAERRQLRSVALSFRELNAQQPMWKAYMNREFHGRNEDECVCLCVIDNVRKERDLVANADAVADRLTREMEQMRHSDGLVRID